jgi:tectonin-like protein
MNKVNSSLLIKKFLITILFLVTLNVFSETIQSKTKDDEKWSSLPGRSIDISVSADGVVYAVANDGRIWRWSNKVGEDWRSIPGKDFIRVDVGSDNKPWAINQEAQLLYFNGIWWEDRGAGFVDVGTGANKEIYAIDKVGNLHRWNPKEKKLELTVSTNAIRIDIDPKGDPWIINADGSVSVYKNQTWQFIEANLVDISISPEGQVFGVNDRGYLTQWQPKLKNWKRVSKFANVSSVSIGLNAKPWLVLKDGKVFALNAYQKQIEEVVSQETEATNQQAGLSDDERRAQSVEAATSAKPLPRNFINIVGKASEIGIGSDGSVFIIEHNSLNIFRYSEEQDKFFKFPGELKRISVTPDGNPWGINPFGDVVRYKDNHWEKVKGIEKASDIDISHQGDIFATSLESKVYRFSKSKDIFERYRSVTGRQIAVTPDGLPWTVSKDGRITRCSAKECKRVSSFAKDIAIGPAGNVFIASMENTLQQFNFQDDRFNRVKGIEAIRLDIGPNDQPWVVNSNGSILAATLFKRNESQDEQTIIANQSDSTTPNTPTITFTKNIKFEKINIPTPIVSTAFDVGGDNNLIYRYFDGKGFPHLYKRIDPDRDAFKELDLDNWSPVGIEPFEVDPLGRLVTIHPIDKKIRRQKNADSKAVEIIGTIGNLPIDTTTFFSNKCRASDLPNYNLDIGNDGTMFLVLNTHILAKFNEKRKKFEVFDKQPIFSQVAVDPNGSPWVIDTDNRLRVYDGKQFNYVRDETKIRALAIGGDNSVYACSDFPDHKLLRFNRSNDRFDETTSSCICVNAGPDGKIFIYDFTEGLRESKN